jgi:predicted Fe-S protein YdhL (DUF1289 family)
MVYSSFVLDAEIGVPSAHDLWRERARWNYATLDELRAVLRRLLRETEPRATAWDAARQTTRGKRDEENQD